MLVIREGEYVAAPWKNGGGVTREILRESRDGDAFDWRLSLATIDAPGPFSQFSGYDRTLVFVRGAGVELSFEQRRTVLLREAGEIVHFDGEWPVQCRLLNGSSTDLNLMVRRERFYAASHCVAVPDSQSFPASQWLRSFVCCLRGSIRLKAAAGTVELAATDTASCTSADGELTCEASGPDPALVFFAGIAAR